MKFQFTAIFARRSGKPFPFLSIIIGLDLEIALRMCADRADSGSLLPYHDVTAVAADPHDLFALLKYLLHLDVVDEPKISFLMRLLDLTYGSELSSK